MTEDNNGDAKITAAMLLGSDTLGDGYMVTSVVMVATAVDLETGEEAPFIIEDDYLPAWKAYGLLKFAADTYFDGLGDGGD